MQTCQRVSDLRAQLAQARSAGKRIALVATMGNLHEGHLQLIRLAKTLADVVVASIFVNPLQFGLNEDWEQYPRTLERDSAMLSAEGCDLLFCPTETDMYPNGMETQTKVEVPTMTNILCGASRPGHFLGVTTVVAKLLLPRGDAIALVYGTVMRNLSIALALAMNAFGSASSDAALVITLAYIIQVQSAAWYVKLTDTLFGKKPAA